jgi:RHS repeat-associated protein
VGSLRAVADAAGNVVKRIAYDSFGNTLEDANPSFAVPFGFAGGLHDRDTGLVRFGYRDYDPEVGRWTAKDPIGFAGGDTDLYGYALNNPVNFVDENGLFIESILKIFDKDKKVQDASNRINQLILEKGQIINKCISSGCSPTDYDKLNEIESQISDTRQQAIEDVKEAANEVSKSYLDLIFEIIKKGVPCK